MYCQICPNTYRSGKRRPEERPLGDPTLERYRLRRAAGGGAVASVVRGRSQEHATAARLGGGRVYRGLMAHTITEVQILPPTFFSWIPLFPWQWQFRVKPRSLLSVWFLIWSKWAFTTPSPQNEEHSPDVHLARHQSRPQGTKGSFSLGPRVWGLARCTGWW